MSRYIVDMNTGKPDDFIRFVSEDYFVKEGFKQELRDGEVIWRKGSGWLTAPQFIKLLYQNGQVHLEAWLKYPVLPGVFVGEMGVTGFFAALPKGMLKSSVDTLVALFYQQPAVPVAAPVPQRRPPARRRHRIRRPVLMRRARPIRRGCRCSRSRWRYITPPAKRRCRW